MRLTGEHLTRLYDRHAEAMLAFFARRTFAPEVAVDLHGTVERRALARLGVERRALSDDASAALLASRTAGEEGGRPYGDARTRAPLVTVDAIGARP